MSSAFSWTTSNFRWATEVTATATKHSKNPRWRSRFCSPDNNLDYSHLNPMFVGAMLDRTTLRPSKDNTYKSTTED